MERNLPCTVRANPREPGRDAGTRRGSGLVWPALPRRGASGARAEGRAHDARASARRDAGGAGQREVGWGDCCGIPVPSVFGAAAAEKEKGLPGGGLSGPGIRAVPFD